MNCPVCQSALQAVQRQGVEIDHCPRCKGVWLDRGELDKLIERGSSSSDDSDVFRRPPPTSAPYPPGSYAPHPDPRHKKKGFWGEVFDFG